LVVGPGEEQPRQRGAHLPAARQLLDRPVELLPGEAQALENPLAAVAPVALLEVGEHLVGVGELRRQVQPLLVVLGRRQRRLDRRRPLGEPRPVGHRGEHGVDHRPWRQLEDVLRQVAGAHALAEGDGPGVGLHPPGEELEQRRLAGAVGPHQPYAIVRADGEARLVQQGPGAEAEGELADGDEAHGGS
jgi:hypothetical protein